MSARWKTPQPFVFLVPWLFFHFFTLPSFSPLLRVTPSFACEEEQVVQGFREVKLPETLDTVLAPSHSRNPTNPRANLVVNIPKHHTVLCSCFVQKMSPRGREKHNLFLEELREKPAPTFLKTRRKPNYFHLIF